MILKHDLFEFLFAVGFVLVFTLVFLRSIGPKNTLVVKLGIVHDELQRFIKESRKHILICYLVFTPMLLIAAFYVLISKSDTSYAVAVVVSMGILFLILLSLLLAILYAPKKLYVTTGAAIAFVLTAAFFEAFIIAKSFMESV